MPISKHAANVTTNVRKFLSEIKRIFESVKASQLL
jgi:hypothetical protein